jgi:hypothetical protein
MLFQPVTSSCTVLPAIQTLTVGAGIKKQKKASCDALARSGAPVLRQIGRHDVSSSSHGTA